MLNTVAILFVNNTFFNEKQNKTCKFLLDQLHLINFEVEKISIVKEDENTITHELEFLSREYDIVIVIDTGIKTNILCKAFSNISKEQLVEQTQDTSDSNSHNHIEQSDKKLYSTIIRSLKLNDNSQSNAVLYYILRIFILNQNNIEVLFTQLLKKYLEHYQKEAAFKKKFQIKMNGMTLENKGKNVEHFSDSGGPENHKMEIIQIEKADFEAIVEDEKILRKQFCDNVTEVCERDFTFECIFNSIEEHVQTTIKIIEQCLETYGLDNIFITFNGGKDCTVLLHLFNIVKRIRYADYRKPIFCLYVRDNDTFPEQDDFVDRCRIYYNLDILTISLGMKEALETLLNKKQNLKACFLGTRRTDPHAKNLNTFQMTDPSWPSVMRVSPLLEWHYTDIWNYLLFYKVPYCKLYDQGYTSLGSASSTVRNPFLLHHSVKLNKKIFLPAYKLLNEAEERRGRNEVKK